MKDNKWSYKPLSALCGINLGNTPSRSKSEYWGKGYSWVSISDLKEKYVSKTKEEITDVALAESNCKIVKNGTLLMSFKLSIGKLAFAEKDLYTNEAIVALPIKDESELLKEYLYYVLKSIPLVGGNQAAMGQTLNKQSLSVLQIPLPPTLDHQKRIAKVLSQCEALIQKRKESIDLFDALLKSKFIEMFGDPRTNSKKWEMDSVITYADCIVPARDKPKSFTGSTPWVTTVDLLHLGKTKKSKQNIGLTDDEISRAGARVIPKDSVIMTCVGDLGVVTIAESNMVINQQLHAFQCMEKMNNIFLMYVLSFQKYFMYKVASKTTVPYMNKTNCNSIPVIKPPIDFQNEFATAFEKINEVKNYTIASLKKLESLYGSISQRAFNGELDLSKVNISDMEDSKKKDETEETIDFPMKEKIDSLNIQALLDEIENQKDKTYLSDNCQLYIDKSKEIRTLVYTLEKRGGLDIELLRDHLSELNEIGEMIIQEVKDFSPYQIDLQKSAERYLKLLPENILDEYLNINLFSRSQFDYRSMSLDEYYGIPDEIIAEYGSIESHEINFEFFFKKYFSNQTFTISEVEALYNRVVYDRGDWFNYEDFKEIVFKGLEGDDAFFKQIFDEKDKCIKLEII